MEMRFSDAMLSRRWSRNWTQSIAINAPREQMVQAADDLSAALSAFKGELQPGDVVALAYSPLDGTSLSVNGVTLMAGASADLFNLFLSSWIGPVPPSTDFKNAVLGRGGWQDAYTAFQQLTPAEGRVAAIEAWVSDSEEQDAEVAEAEAEAAAEEEAKRQVEERKAEEERQARLAEEQRLAEEEAARRAAEAEAEEPEPANDEVAETDETGTSTTAAAAAPAQPQPETTPAGQSQPRETEVASVEAAPVESATPVGSGDGADAGDDFSVEAILAQQDYTTRVVAQIYKSVSYPAMAVRREHEGSVRAIITLNRAGNLQAMQIIEEAPYSSLNEAVEDAVRDAAPFPPIPAEIREETIDLMVPVSFQLN